MFFCFLGSKKRPIVIVLFVYCKSADILAFNSVCTENETACLQDVVKSMNDGVSISWCEVRSTAD